MILNHVTTQDLMSELAKRPGITEVRVERNKNYFVAGGIDPDGEFQDESIPGEGPAIIMIAHMEAHNDK